VSERLFRKDFVRRLAAAIRALSMYAARHPLVERNVSALFDACLARLHESPAIVVGFLDADVVVDGAPVRHASAALAGLARTFAQREIERVSFLRGLTKDDLRAGLHALADGAPQAEVAARLEAAGVWTVTIGRITADDVEPQPPGLQAAIRVYDSAFRTAETFFETVRANGQPDAAAAKKVVSSLAQVVSDDRPSLMALTVAKRHDAYTFTHMVNVSVLTMALARSLGVDAGLVREFGLAGLMHDIGKTRTPLDILNKPGKLTPSEVPVMQRHVVDGGELLWDMSDMPPLSAIVAFEHHLRQDRTGYPERTRAGDLNLCTMIVSIADVFDALRTNRPYRQGLATVRVRAMLAEQNGTAFHRTLLKRFVTVVGLFPVGSLVRLESGAIGVVTHEHPEDPLRPQVKIVTEPDGARLDEPHLVNTWERDARGECLHAVAEAIDPEEAGLDPLTLL
jgi:putative nucleotidyltransferase with HDIG domain